MGEYQRDLCMVASAYIDDPTSVSLHDRNALFLWLRQRFDQAPESELFGVVAMQVGANLNVIDAKSDIKTIVQVVDMCMEAWRHRIDRGRGQESMPANGIELTDAQVEISEQPLGPLRSVDCWPHLTLPRHSEDATLKRVPETVVEVAGPAVHGERVAIFMERASREIYQVFGSETRHRLEIFHYPGSPAEFEYHVVIDPSPLSPSEAIARFDKLCDDWWDDASVSLGIYPVLGVIDLGIRDVHSSTNEHSTTDNHE